MGAFTAMAIIGGVAMAASAIGAGIEAKNAKNKKETLEGEMNDLREKMPDPINPYAGIEFTNEFANLGVSTQAAEFQAEQADLSLANTLDAMKAGGYGSGGATALARMAAQSKKGVAITLEQQEVANNKARAQGAMEAQKLNNQAQVAGRQYLYEAQDKTWERDADRKQGMIDQQAAAEAQYKGDMWGAIGGFGSSMMGAAGNIPK
jgi:hypothetical protein